MNAERLGCSRLIAFVLFQDVINEASFELTHGLSVVDPAFHHLVYE